MSEQKFNLIDEVRHWFDEHRYGVLFIILFVLISALITLVAVIGIQATTDTDSGASLDPIVQQEVCAVYVDFVLERVDEGLGSEQIETLWADFVAAGVDSADDLANRCGPVEDIAAASN